MLSVPGFVAAVCLVSLAAFLGEAVSWRTHGMKLHTLAHSDMCGDIVEIVPSQAALMLHPENLMNGAHSSAYSSTK